MCDPHPHIGLATVTYLFDGEMMHRDTLGSLQEITPGDVNWMTAGKGIAHSERTSAIERGHAHKIHGIQTWVALPKEAEECDPEFFHHESKSLPQINLEGVKLRIIAGEAFGQTSPVKTFSPIFYVEANMEKGANLEIPQDYSERAFYVISGDVSLNNEKIEPHTMVILNSGTKNLIANSSAHLMLLGGEPLTEKRHIYWNFVSSSLERIEQAKRDWEKGRFGKIPGDENEFIPLPEEPKKGTIL